MKAQRRPCDALCGVMATSDMTLVRLNYMWIETYSTVSTQHEFMKAAWILLEYILIFPDRRAPYWEMRHAPNRVKAARCGIDGMKLMA